MLTAKQIIDELGLVPLAGEGGMYLQTYLSNCSLDGKPAGSAIYYLLTADSFSHLHRLTGDEVYHFYLGDAVEICELKPDGSHCISYLGNNLLSGERPQHTVLAGVWQGSRLKPGGSWALLGTTMCPAYDDDCYEHGDAEMLSKQYPAAQAYIKALTGAVKAY